MNNNIVSTCAILAATAAFCPFALSAMPTRAELKEAQPIVSELMAADVAALKAGKTDAKAVAEKALGYAEEASTDAAKYLLLQGAFYNYTNAKDYDKAAETVDKLRETIPDMEPTALSAMIAKALRKGRAAGRLSEMLEELERETRYARLMADVDAELKSKPKDSKLLQMSAEYHALTGDWKDALPKFEQLGGKFADVVTFEKGKSSKLTAAEVGDFWWGYPVAGEGEEAMNGFKRHAVRFYRQALQDTNFKGLKRTIVEKRLAALGGTAATVSASAGEQPKAVVTKIAEGVRPENLTFKLDDKESLDMVGCPAGSIDYTKFRDCNNLTNWFFWCGTVTISRPFWYAKYPMSIRQWRAYRPLAKFNETALSLVGDNALHCDSLDDVEEFCRWLTKKYKSKIPRGYVFRLPTLAEYQYANTADGTGVGDSGLHLDRWRYAAKQWFERKGSAFSDEKIKSLADPHGREFSCPAGYASPNGWGVYDPLIPTYLLDVTLRGVANVKTTALFCRKDQPDPFLCPRLDQIKDRSMIDNPSKKNRLYHFHHFNFGMIWVGNPWDSHFPFRIVLGPDLLKERGLAK